ncbi:DUF2807 domain-containing protein [Paraflavitalea soli]|uniref:DUF2807 domain-containing protein n=1 Tax=Paraflavitalea soli TaxID=2315862 RepID=A0A3B7MQZ4_9BACT|nr:head GIN domain-containing protein [Paraflavitalea soli]AXY75773.1 DUF2807 domain-containing protein [Paraflavitalea soli]
MKKLIFILCAVNALVLSSCDFVAGKRVKGNGNVQTVDRPETGFEGIVGGSNFDTYVGIGPYSVKIEAEENIIPYIETFVDNGVLRIETKDGFWLKPRRAVKITVTAPRLTRIHSSGNGNIISTTKLTDSSRIDLRVTGNAEMKVEVDAPEIEAELTGNGGIEVKGLARNFNCKTTGNGHIEAMDLQTESTKVEIFGNGNANVNASVKLDVRIGGNGDVRYKGSAQTSTHITGNGSLKKVD